MDVFGGAPRFLAYPRPVVVQSGTDAVLKCQIGGDPRPAVIWERNNEKIHPEGRYRVFEDGNVYNLIISAVNTEDSGQYICKAKNSIGETYAAATLKVEGEAQEMEFREENKPRFLIKPLSTRVGRGEDAVFSCKLWGNPKPEVIWEKDGKKLNEIFESTHFNVGYQDGGWFQLKIFKARAPDGGVYTCKARNEFGESLAGAVLLVDAGPGHEEEVNRNGYTNGHWKAHPGKQRCGRQVLNRLRDDSPSKSTKVKMFAVTEGKHAKFRCFVTGKPKPEIIWRKDGRLILSGRRYLLYEDREGYFTLKVLYCKQKDNGVYVCAASNTAGQTLSAVHLSVKEPLVRFKQPLIDLEVWERDLAILECEVPEDSVPITWYLEDRRLQPGAKYGMEEWGTKRRLTIRDIGVDDDGIYLCEMPDGGRSIAEVAVKGTIMRKLPRKVDVLEGENAAFCVEVEKEEMDIHWYKEGIELRETHQTILKSFGRTHILVFVNTMPQDSGLVTFLVGRSKTSSQLRVKSARHCPPSCPVGVQINTERANAALLSWVPPQDTRKNPPSGYVLERQEVGTGSQEWLQCLTTDSATSVEILGDSVPCEADYRFRICSVNKYGKSNNVEFPKTVHLVPVARIQAPLQDALVPEGQDALFSIELSSSVIGTWFLNGTQLQEDERFSMRRSRSHQSLRIRGVRDIENGAEITFIAYGIRDSAALYIQAPLVKFSHLSEMDRNKFVEIGNPIVLYCELSDPAAPVHWYKNGVELQTMEGLHIQSEGTMRRIVIQSAEFSHSGVYCCDAIDDVIRFNVEVEAPPVKFSAILDAEHNKTVQTGCPIVLRCKLSDASAQVYWYKDGSKLHPQSGLDLISEGFERKLIVDSAELFHSGLYCCKTKSDSITFSVDIQVPPMKFAHIPEEMRTKSIEAGCPLVLQCVVSPSEAEVAWYKDEILLISNSGLEIQSDGDVRKLVIQSTELHHSGVYRCTTQDDAVEFQVDIKALPVTHSAMLERTKSFEVGKPLELECEVADTSVPVCWYKDGRKLLIQNGWDVQSSGMTRKLIIPSAELLHSGLYSCETSGGTIHFTVDIEAPMLVPPPSAEVVEMKALEGPCPTEPACKPSDPDFQVSWQENRDIDSIKEADFENEGVKMSLVVEPNHSSNSGSYYSATVDDVAQLIVPPPTSLLEPDFEKAISAEARCPIVQQFEISDPVAKACWYKDGTLIYPKREADCQSQCSSKIKPNQSQYVSNDGTIGCDTSVDAHLNEDIKAEQCHYADEIGEVADAPVQNSVDIKALTQNLSPVSEPDPNMTAITGSPIALQCELSEHSGQDSWSKNGEKLLPPSGVDIQSGGSTRSPVAPLAEQAHTTTVCHSVSKDERIWFAEGVKGDKALPVKFCEQEKAERNKSVQEGAPVVLKCQLAHNPSAVVVWYKDGTKLHPQDNVKMQSDSLTRTLLIQSAQHVHAGTYKCSTSDDAITFTVDVQGRSPQIMPITLSEKFKTITLGSPIILQCEVSDPKGQVSWFKDEEELFCRTGLNMKREGNLRKLLIHSAKASDSGLYRCKLLDDVVTFNVDIEETPPPPVRLPSSPEVARNERVETGCPIIPPCDVSEPNSKVYWLKDGEQPTSISEHEVPKREGPREVVIPSAEVRHCGVYRNRAADNLIEIKVDVAALPEVEMSSCTGAGEPVKQQNKLSQTCGYEDDVKVPAEPRENSNTESFKRTLPPASSSAAHSRKNDSDYTDVHDEVKAPPVTFVNVKESDLYHSVVEQEELVLTCEVSRDDGDVVWYKDGVEMQPNSHVTMQAEGNKRNVTIPSAQLLDAGTYTCRAGENILYFKVNIREPPVMIIHPKEDVHLDRHVPEEIILSCELSRPNGAVSWFKDGQKLQESENIKLKVEGPYRRLKIISGGVEDSGEYVCDTADDSKFFQLSITEPPVQIVSPSQSQMELCQQTSERMVLSCEISRPNALVRWYRDGLEVEENDNLILEVDGVYRRLIIPETTVRDSAEYVCDTADDSVTFFVNIAEPPVRFVRPRKMACRVEKRAGETLVLDCEVSRPNADVTWKKNGEEVEDCRNVTIFDDGVMRQLTIHSLTLEDAGQYVCDAKDDVMDFSVNVQDLPVKIVGKTDAKTQKQFLVSDDIILVCELSRSNAPVRWYKDDHLIGDSERHCVEEQGVFRSLVVLNASLTDSGEYTCDAGDDMMLFHITVAEPPVEIIGNSGHPEHHMLVAGDDLILECEVSRPNAAVHWLRNGEELKPDSRVKIDSYDVVRKLVIYGLQPSDSGKYICDAINDKLITIVEVQEPPVKFVNKIENNIISAFESESVTLRAVVSCDRANVRWLKGGQLLNQDNIHISSEGNTHRLTINPLQLSDSGDYVCDVNTDEMSFSLLVKEMKVRFLRRMESVACPKGSRLTLLCEVNKPKGDVQWLKDGAEVAPSRRHTIRAQGRERSFTIHQLTEEDAGEYVCESTDDRTCATVTVETPRLVEFVAELRSITVCEGEDAVFKCVVSPADTKVVWRLRDKPVALTERAVVSSNGLCHMLCINNCVVSDSGRVTAEAEGTLSEAELQVQEQHVLFTRKMLPVVGEEYGEATLEVEVSVDSEDVQWMRQGVLIHAGAKYALRHEGRQHSLTIHSLALMDRGTYSCETLHDRTQAQLTVEPRKVSIRRGLSDVRTTERETASFEVELSHPNIPGRWTRNGIQLKPTNHFRMSAKGQVHSLTIYNLSVEDTGTFVFSVENQKTSARLVVKEPPVTIFRKLEDQRFPEGATISLECELSRHNVDVKWMKNGQEVKPSRELRIYAMGRKRFLQILKSRVSDSGVYACDAGDITTCCSVEVYVQRQFQTALWPVATQRQHNTATCLCVSKERELLILQGMEDVNIKEDQNAVFVCEISVEDVPGEWYRNGVQIHPTSTIKIRQEGTKHFLLMCNVRAEDSGEIKFVARHVETVAALQIEELPVNIVNPLQDKTALEKSRVIMDCTVSNPRCSIRWYKGPSVVLPSERFEISSEGCYRKLIIQQVALHDEGTYSVQVGEYSCSAKLTVEAQSVLMIRELTDVEVVTSEDACFECELSELVFRPPVWTLNGEALQPGPRVRVEKMGPVHRLTLRKTSPHMDGVVEFSFGTAKSRARLTVISKELLL
ncbi:obscurin-like protein 1 isoform X11 [Gouania willdenowi]|uniref:obscurin-like protein 1 isoform X11 n=1 Tax=Gouania willdenowi TaxID=441366 RepID=UPI00105567D1|nr:obscurin-like protein 1 isoform X11 [Gouania willdenowi]